MENSELYAKPVAELLRLTQTNNTPDANEGYAIAQVAYERADNPIDKGVAARQGAFRAEQAGMPVEKIEDQFNKARSALSSDDPDVRRNLVAVDILTVRAYTLRQERLGKIIGSLAVRSNQASLEGEAILDEQHKFGRSWDRFGTMLSSYRSIYESRVNNRALTAAAVAANGIWRAVRAKNEGTPDSHLKFMVKHVGINAVAGTLALSKPLEKLPFGTKLRHKAALKILARQS